MNQCVLITKGEGKGVYHVQRPRHALDYNNEGGYLQSVDSPVHGDKLAIRFISC